MTTTSEQSGLPRPAEPQMTTISEDRLDRCGAASREQATHSGFVDEGSGSNARACTVRAVVAVMMPGKPVADAVFADMEPRVAALRAAGHNPGLGDRKSVV